jgi:hypothetical protein
MRHHKVRALVVAIAVALAGCKTAGPTQSSSSVPLTPAEQQMRQDQDRFRDTVISGVLTGAVAGAAVGAIGAAIFGGDSKQIRNSAIGGAVVGATVTGIDAYVTAKQEQAGRDKIRAVQAATADVQTDNRKLQAYLDSSSRVLAEGKARLASLRSDVQQKKIGTADAEAARAREERNIASMNETLTNAKSTRDQYVAASNKMIDSPQNKRDLDNEIRRMNQQISQLEGNVAAYNEALRVSKA